MFKDENRHYSLRKLSVGLASVLIGISFASSMNSNSVKADTVSAQTSAIETKTSENKVNTNVDVTKEVVKDQKITNQSNNHAEDNSQTQPQNTQKLNEKVLATQLTKVQDQTATIQSQEKAQTSFVQNSVADQPQKNLLDNLGKQKASAQLGDQAETKNQENRLVDQINYKLTSNDSTDNKEDLGQNKVAPDETKSNPTTKSDAEKDIVSPNSAQQVNNQSSDHADDNSQSQLNITKNSQQFTKKELATNLTEINNLPAFGSASLDDRATGTKNTRVGDTRLSNDQLKHIAISSDIKLTPNGHTDKPYKDGQIANIKMNQCVSVGLTGTTTIDKNDLKKGNNILIGTVQMSNDRYGQTYDKVPKGELNMNNVIGGIGYDSQSESHEPEVANASYQQAVNIDYDGKQLGRVTIAGLHDKNEFDIYLHVDNEFDFATDPTFTFKQNFFLAINNQGGGQNSTVFTGIKPKDSLNVQFDTNTHKYQVHFNYAQINAPLVTTVGTNDSNTISIDTSARRIYLNNSVPSHFFNTDKNGNYDPNNFTFKDNGEYDEAIKIASSSNNPITNIISYARAYKFVRNADNKALGGDLDANWNERAVIMTRKVDNLTAKDLLDQTPVGTASWSKQADGSVIIAEKLISSNFTSIPINSVSNTWATTAADPNHAQQIIQNTNKHVNDHNWSNNIEFGLANNNATTITVMDITPQSYSPYVGHKMKSILGITNSNGSGSTTVETWRYANISYVDDDNNETEMNKNTIQGLRNKGTEYTIQIPKGYSLVDPKDGTNYKWNADHTKITYTFADNQSLNEKNPIIIHLKHKIQDVSATDPNAKQTNTYKVIENLPDGIQKKIAELDITSHRSATKDMVTGNVTYGNWDANKAEVSTGAGDDRIVAAIDAVPGYTYVNIPRFESIEKANNGNYVIGFWIDENNNANIDLLFGNHRDPGITYKSMPASQTFYINYTPNKQTVNYIFYDDTSNKQLDDTKTSYTGVTDGSTNVSLTLPTNYVLSDGQTLPTSYMFKASNPDVLIHVKHATRVSKDLDHADPATRRIVVYMPDNSTLTYLQTLNYVRDVIVDLVTNTTTYGTKYNFDANTSSVVLDAPDNLKAQYASSLPAKAYMQTSSGNVYLDKDGYAYFSSIKLPKLPGYKAHLIKDPVNPTAFLVSFVALPEQLQNNQSTSNNVQSPQKPTQTKQKQPESIQNQPAEKQQQEITQILNHISYTLMHNDSSDTADNFEPTQNDSAPLETADVTQKVKPEPAKPSPIETQVPVGTHDSLNKYTLTTNDPLPDTLVFNNIESDQATQTYDVVLSHQTEAAHRTHEVHETVDYVYADGSQASKSFTAKPLVFKQNIVKNSAQSTTQDTNQLPQTGSDEQANLLSIIGGSLMTSLALFGLDKKKKHKN